jgi:hypothetical protein
LPALFVSLVLLGAEAKKGSKWGVSSGHTTKLEQSRFSLDIYEKFPMSSTEMQHVALFFLTLSSKVSRT